MAAGWNPEDAPYLLSLLGPLPESTATRALWDAAAQVIEGYRQRWGIVHQGSAFGPPSTDSRQWHDREAAIAQVRVHLETLRQRQRRDVLDLATRTRPQRDSTAADEPPRLPLQPLLDALPIDQAVARDCGNGPGPIQQAATLLGLTRRTLHRYRHTGLDPRTADRLACKVGLHPLVVWGEAWEAAERAKALRTPGAERGLA